MAVVQLVARMIESRHFAECMAENLMPFAALFRCGVLVRNARMQPTLTRAVQLSMPRSGGACRSGRGKPQPVERQSGAAFDAKQNHRRESAFAQEHYE